MTTKRKAAKAAPKPKFNGADHIHKRAWQVGDGLEFFGAKPNQRQMLQLAALISDKEAAAFHSSVEAIRARVGAVTASPAPTPPKTQNAAHGEA